MAGAFARLICSAISCENEEKTGGWGGWAEGAKFGPAILVFSGDRNGG